MNIEYLVTMANQIGAFFEAEADAAEARGDIANHLKKFWDPRMRRQLVDYVDTENGIGLTRIVVDAVKAHRDGLCGTATTILADDRWVGPEGGSDAG